MMEATPIEGLPPILSPDAMSSMKPKPKRNRRKRTKAKIGQAALDLTDAPPLALELADVPVEAIAEQAAEAPADPVPRDISAEILHWRHGLALQFAKARPVEDRSRARNFVIGHISLIKKAFKKGRLRADVLAELGVLYEAFVAIWPAPEMKPFGPPPPGTFQSWRHSIARQLCDAHTGSSTKDRARRFVASGQDAFLADAFINGKTNAETLAYLKEQFAEHQASRLATAEANLAAAMKQGAENRARKAAEQALKAKEPPSPSPAAKPLGLPAKPIATSPRKPVEVVVIRKRAFAGPIR